MEVPNLLPLSVLIICVHVSPPKNSQATKSGLSSKASFFFLFSFLHFAFKASMAAVNRWLRPQKQHLTDDQVQPRTSREIREQLQMAMTVTHPSLRCLFHPQSLLNPPAPSPAPLPTFLVSLMTLTIRSGITRDSWSLFNEV